MTEEERLWAEVDHPRSRGVYWETFKTQARNTGSSPLARGLRMGRSRPRRATRIIPARAGFTAPSRGNHVGASGSSPLARGLLVGEHGFFKRMRIIPARAGFTSPRGA